MIDADLIRAAFASLSAQAITFLPIITTALVFLIFGWLTARILAS